MDSLRPAMERRFASAASDAVDAGDATYVSLDYERGTHTCGQLPTAVCDEGDDSHDVKQQRRPARDLVAGGFSPFFRCGRMTAV